MPTKKKTKSVAKTTKKSSKPARKTAADKAPKVDWEAQAKGWFARAQELENVSEQLQAQLAFYASQATHDVLQELAQARRVHPTPMHSAHEGYAVLEEEVDELWEVVKFNPGDDASDKRLRLIEMREEAVQVAAMALRFINEVCDKEFVN